MELKIITLLTIDLLQSVISCPDPQGSRPEPKLIIFYTLWKWPFSFTQLRSWYSRILATQIFTCENYAILGNKNPWPIYDTLVSSRKNLALCARDIFDTETLHATLNPCLSNSWSGQLKVLFHQRRFSYRQQWQPHGRLKMKRQLSLLPPPPPPLSPPSASAVTAVVTACTKHCPATWP